MKHGTKHGCADLNADALSAIVDIASDPLDPDNTAQARVMRLKGYGNAIVVPQATMFIEAYL